MAASVVSRTVTWPRSLTPAWAWVRKRASERADGVSGLFCRGRAVLRSQGRTSRAQKPAFIAFEGGAGSGSRSGSRRIIFLGAEMGPPRSTLMIREFAWRPSRAGPDQLRADAAGRSRVRLERALAGLAGGKADPEFGHWLCAEHFCAEPKSLGRAGTERNQESRHAWTRPPARPSSAAWCCGAWASSGPRATRCNRSSAQGICGRRP